MAKFGLVCGLLMLGFGETGVRDWMIDAALAPVVPVGKAMAKMSGSMVKRTSKGVIAYNGDMESLKRNPTPWKRGSGKKIKKEIEEKKKGQGLTVEQGKQLVSEYPTQGVAGVIPPPNYGPYPHPYPYPYPYSYPSPSPYAPIPQNVKQEGEAPSLPIM